ncbi:hypothetical protein Ahy_A06g028548 [Arachis hypogaea]|uniref:Uncharacterized protein n=1 Tax=Arachis hypogaea TaxID=3818 RepID=A0A445CRC8_ARAHY|nr:hypothetical protein Ahy_A06g028548 [Arachis hypogaea]
MQQAQQAWQGHVKDQRYGQNEILYLNKIEEPISSPNEHPTSAKDVEERLELLATHRSHSLHRYGGNCYGSGPRIPDPCSNPNPAYRKTKKLPSRRPVKVTAAFARLTQPRRTCLRERGCLPRSRARRRLPRSRESVAVRSPSPPRARSRLKSRCPVSYRRRRRCHSYSPSCYNRGHRSRSPVRSHHYSSYEKDRMSYRDIREHSDRSRRRDSARYLDRHSSASRRNRSRSMSPHSRKSH